VPALCTVAYHSKLRGEDNVENEVCSWLRCQVVCNCMEELERDSQEHSTMYVCYCVFNTPEQSVQALFSTHCSAQVAMCTHNRLYTVPLPCGDVLYSLSE